MAGASDEGPALNKFQSKRVLPSTKAHSKIKTIISNATESANITNARNNTFFIFTGVFVFPKILFVTTAAPLTAAADRPGRALLNNDIIRKPL